MSEKIKKYLFCAGNGDVPGNGAGTYTDTYIVDNEISE